jgi:hypothetical protein
MTARTSKASKRTKANGKPEPITDAHLEQPMANDSAPALATTDKANGNRRPSVTYSEELGDIICAKLRDGETLNGICKAEGMPNESTVRLWAADPSHPFSPKYARAREVGYARLFDEMLEIADDATNDWVDRKMANGELERVVDHEHIKRSALRVDTRKWMLSKALPKVYGDRLEVDAKAGLMVVETPAAIKALLEALPDLGVLANGALPAIAAPAQSGDEEAS